VDTPATQISWPWTVSPVGIVSFGTLVKILLLGGAYVDGWSAWKAFNPAFRELIEPEI
jgi:hypothetical protein